MWSDKPQVSDVVRSMPRIQSHLVTQADKLSIVRMDISPFEVGSAKCSEQFYPSCVEGVDHLQ